MRLRGAGGGVRGVDDRAGGACCGFGSDGMAQGAHCVAGDPSHFRVRTNVPWLRDELDLAEDGVLGDGADEGRCWQQVPPGVAAQRRGEVESESVDVVLRHPLAQGVEDEAGDGGVVGVDGVATARVVEELRVGV